MLQSLRDNLKGTFAFIIIAIIIVPLALFGVDSLFSGSDASNTAAEVNGESIFEPELRRAVYMQREQMKARFGENLPEEFVSDERLRQPVLNNLIDRSVLSQAAVSQGMAVSSSKLDQLILTTPQFQVDGRFDSEQFVALLRNMNYTPTTYKVVLEQDVISNQQQLGVSASAFVLPNELASRVALSQQVRKFSYVTLPLADKEKELVISADEVSSYYADNKSQFIQSEQVAIEYIDLTPDALVGKVEISDEDIQQQYEANVEAFAASTERRAAHILLEIKEDASEQVKLKEIQSKLAAGESFSELAKTYSEDVGSSDAGGDLGFSSGDTFPEAFEDALAGLEIDQVSAAVETDAGIHLIQLLEIRGDSAPTLEDQKASIIYTLKRAQAEAKYDDLLENIAELSYNAESLSEVGLELDLVVAKSELFGRSGGYGLTAEAKVLDAVFSEEVLNDGNSSELIEFANQRAVVVKLIERVESHVKPLEVVSAEVEAKLKSEKARALLNDEGQALIAQLQQGKSLQELAQAAELTISEEVSAARSGSDVSGEIVEKVFSLPKPTSNSVVEGFSLNSGDFVVVDLKAVVAGDLASMDESSKQGLSAQLAQTAASADFSGYSEVLKQAATIDIR